MSLYAHGTGCAALSHHAAGACRDCATLSSQDRGLLYTRLGIITYHHIDACRRRGQGTRHRCRTFEGECNSLNRSAVSARSGTQAPRNRGVLRGTQRG